MIQLTSIWKDLPGVVLYEEGKQPPSSILGNTSQQPAGYLTGVVNVLYDADGAEVSVPVFLKEENWFRVDKKHEVVYVHESELSGSGINLISSSLDDLHEQGLGTIDSFLLLKDRKLIFFKLNEEWKTPFEAALGKINTYLVIAISGDDEIAYDFLEERDATKVILRTRNTNVTRKKVTESPAEFITAHLLERQATYKQFVEMSATICNFTDVGKLVVSILGLPDATSFTSHEEYMIMLSRFITEPSFPELVAGIGDVFRLYHAAMSFYSIGNSKRTTSSSETNRFLSLLFRGQSCLMCEKVLKVCQTMLPSSEEIEVEVTI